MTPSVVLGSSYDDDFDPQSRLMRAARAVIDRLAVEVADTATSVLLADARARILDRRVGMGTLLAQLDRASAVPGSSFAEDLVGTNGLGTVLEERRPFVVQGTEHFAERLKDFTCVGVPIVNPFTGVLEGIFDLTCRARDASPLMLPLVLEAAREVRQLLVAGSSQTEQAMLAAFQYRGTACPPPGHRDQRPRRDHERPGPHHRPDRSHPAVVVGQRPPR